MADFIKQNAEGLLPIIQKSGCFFRASCHMAELAVQKVLTKEQINAIYEQAKNKNYIDQNDDVMQSAPIANIALRALGSAGRFQEVATFKNGKLNWYSAIPEGQRIANYYIQKGKQNGPQKVHFYNVTKSGETIWDPHAPAIKITGIIYTICYRFIKGE